ncbi:MAG: hypothetical protein AAFO63_12485, partial [Pseudomonadota bacterium]
LRMRIRANYDEQIHACGAEGDAARRNYGQLIQDLGNLENEAWGIEWGYRYDDSPVIWHEDGAAPAYDWEEYAPSSWPGVRPPNVFLEDGTPLFDHLGREFTILKFGDTDESGLVSAAETAGLPLKVVSINDPKIKALYERDLVLVRPDQHVAWRGNSAPTDAAAIIDKVRG